MYKNPHAYMQIKKPHSSISVQLKMTCKEPTYVIGNCNSSNSIMRTCIKKDKVLVPHYLLISERFDSMGSSPVVMI